MEIALAAAGDCIITRSLRENREPAFRALCERVQATDVAFANLELLPHRFEGPPANESGGTWLCCDPALVDDLRWMGFRLFACAHNHAHDWGRHGLLAALRHMDAMGVAYAGVGANLAAARAPRYVETRAGRVAMISAASSFTTEAPAGDPHGTLPGRPGLNPLRVRRTLRVTAEDLRRLEELGDRLGVTAAHKQRVRDGWVKPEPEGTLTLFGQRFVAVDPAAGEQVGEHTEPDPRDLEANLAAIREAARQADFVVMSLHAHEQVAAERERPAAFIPAFARACIDAGAHAVIGHGPHVLRGVEYYRGRPILYSLGNFIFESETMPAQPADYFQRMGLPPDAGPADLFDARSDHDRRGFPADPVFWESVLATLRLRTDGACEVEAVPVTLGHGQGRPRRGVPALASAADGERIMARLDALSRPFGAEVRPAGAGVWRIVPTGAAAEAAASGA
jgi:poly-gamma-glutamate capsule biosynthesis protein CapA/YwtB (metallophosphatase superfamily)